MIGLDVSGQPFLGQRVRQPGPVHLLRERGKGVLCGLSAASIGLEGNTAVLVQRQAAVAPGAQVGNQRVQHVPALQLVPYRGVGGVLAGGRTLAAAVHRDDLYQAAVKGARQETAKAVGSGNRKSMSGDRLSSLSLILGILAVIGLVLFFFL